MDPDEDLETAILQLLRDRGALTWYRLDPILLNRGYGVGVQLARQLNTMVHHGLIEVEKRRDGHTYYTITEAGRRALAS